MPDATPWGPKPGRVTVSSRGRDAIRNGTVHLAGLSSWEPRYPYPVECVYYSDMALLKRKPKPEATPEEATLASPPVQTDEVTERAEDRRPNTTARSEDESWV